MSGCRKSPWTFRQPSKMPLLSRRTAAQKSSLRSPEALHSKASGAFDSTRGGRLPPRAPPPRHRRILFNRGFRHAEAPAIGGRLSLSKKWLPPLFRRSFMKFSPRFLMKLSAKISCEVSFSRRMSPKMTDFHLIPSSADDGTLRGFLFWEFFRHAEAPAIGGRLSGLIHMSSQTWKM